MSNVRDLIQLMKLNRKEIEHLLSLGILKTTEESCQSYHIGKSDYSRHIIQPWNIWLEYNLNPWDADIVKRVLRIKEGEDRKLDYEKIIHVCQERIRQLEAERTEVVEESDEPDYKTVICPSEADRPELLYGEGTEFDGIYSVYGVFQLDDKPYAYLGYWEGAHVYLELGESRMWNYYNYGFLPKRSFGLVNTLRYEDHAVSMEIGKYGVSYEKHDYIITHGNLYRYMDATPEGHVYMRFEDGGSFTKVVTEHKLFNEAIQYVKGNNK